MPLGRRGGGWEKHYIYNHQAPLPSPPSPELLIPLQKKPYIYDISYCTPPIPPPTPPLIPHQEVRTKYNIKKRMV